MVDIIDPKWAELAPSNNSAAPNGYQGSYAPSTIAPTGREQMAGIKRFYVQNNAIYTSGGSASAYTITYGGAPVKYDKGIKYAFWANHTNTGAATLNINSLGAKPIVRNDGAALTAGQIVSGSVAVVYYDGTNFRLQNITANPTFTGQVDVGSLVSAGAINGASLGITGDITLAGTLKVSPANGINFANDDSITYNDSTNTWSFEADTTGGSLTSRISTNKLLLTGTSDAIRIDTPAGDTTSDPYLGFYKAGTIQGYVQHIDGTSTVSGIRMVNSLTGDNIVLNNSGDLNSLRLWDSSTSTAHTIWHSGNSGLADAGANVDMLDGQHGAYYRDLGNATGTLNNARLVGSYSFDALTLTDQITAKGGVQFANNDDLTFNDTTNVFTFTADGAAANSKVTAGQFLDTGGNPTVHFNRVIAAGNGLSGGGDLSANRTVTLGTPGTITTSTTNSVSATSHTHAITLTNSDITDALTYSPANRDRVITAGNGLSGGGALTADRTISMGTPGTITGSTTNSVTSTSHTHALTLTASDINDALGYNPASGARTVSAGSGLTGGGALSSNPTITMGTPGNITNSTTNSVTSTSHTHALGFTAAEVYTGSSATATSFGVGHIVVCHRNGDVPATNGAMGVANRSDQNFTYINPTHSLATTTLTGTWRSRGMIGTGDWVIMQRTA